MAKSPDKNSEGVVGVTIYSEGENIGDSFSFCSAWLYKEVNRIGKATLVFIASDMAGQSNDESDSDTFAPGNEIVVDAGYRQVESELFRGIVVSHRMEISPDEQPRLIVECRDHFFPMTLTRKNRIFTEKTDSGAISEIGSDYSGLTFTVTGTTPEFPELVQYDCTDWDFILSRADTNGLIVVTGEKTLKIKKPDVSGTAVLKVTYGIDLISFSASVQAMGPWGEVEAYAWDPSQQKLISAEGEEPALNSQGCDECTDLATAVKMSKQRLRMGCGMDDQVLQAWADGKLLKKGLSRIQGSFSFSGNAAVLPDTIISLEGVGKRFDGEVYIGSVEHVIEDGKWITTAGMGLSPEDSTATPDVHSPPASGVVPAAGGLHIGKVTQVEEDPLQEYRIQVEVPVLGAEAGTIRARLLSGWAGNGYGMFHIPDVGDEVVLGFFNNDPCHAVIMGSLYSSKQPPPYEITEENTIRGIVSRSGIKIEIEEEKQIVTVETPEGHSIELNDDTTSITIKDCNKNKWVMNESGISVESDTKIVLKAKTNIELEAGGKIEGKAKGDVVLEGMNVNATAKTALTLKGSMKAEVSASGQTVIKGAMVMIN